VQSRLGHASAAETLDTYSHLWPDSEDRTREAVDGVLLDVSRPHRGPRSAVRHVSPGQAAWWWRVGLYAGFCTGPCGPVMAIPLG
jgi:hypothetical protein